MTKKILYALPAVGNGHLARAREILPLLEKYATVDVLVMGEAGHLHIGRDITYTKKGFTMHYTEKGGISMVKTIRGLGMRTFFQDVRTLPVEQYDMVLSDFEPISAWAAKEKNVPCIHMGHQASFRSKHTPRPAHRNILLEKLLFGTFYVPAEQAIGFHFQSYDSFIHTPIIRQEIRQQRPVNNGHITIYLMTYHHEMLITHFKKMPGQSFHIFSRFTNTVQHVDNVTVYPIDNTRFIESLSTSSGLITGGWFEWPAEAMFLGKKVLSIPQTSQYEQSCNAAALQKLGVMTVPKIDSHFWSYLTQWFDEYQPVQVDYPDETGTIIKEILSKI